jgi:hypothetical protein
MAKEKFVAGMYLKTTFFSMDDGDDLLCSTLLTSLQYEISSSHGGEYDVQSCLLGCTAV